MERQMVRDKISEIPHLAAQSNVLLMVTPLLQYMRHSFIIANFNYYRGKVIVNLNIVCRLLYLDNNSDRIIFVVGSGQSLEFSIAPPHFPKGGVEIYTIHFETR